MTNKLRVAAATITAALAIGVAAPLATAAEAPAPALAAAQVQAVKDAGAVNTITLSSDAASAHRDAAPSVTVDGKQLRSLAKDIAAYIKAKMGKEYAKAKAAAKKDYASFVKWVKSLKKDNPVRIVLLEIGGKPLIQLVIQFVR
ncbi:hypothetical protein [Streptomyces sp. NPDC001340]